ncbi:MAG: carboxymuconolactone decarboxylase family protein [Oxalobacteraceae bacterium]|jgi:AhpD family alkylhydroperoxidase
MSEIPDYKGLTKAVTTRMQGLRQTQPDLMKAFSQLAAAGTQAGALDKKTREFVALGIAVSTRCDDCIGFHVQTLVKLGATQAELEEVLATAVYMGGGPSMMYATHALKAFEDYTAN